MKEDQREIQRKLRVLEHADVSGNVRKTCRYFGIGRASFYRWQAAYRRHGEHGLINKKPIPKNPANKTTPEIEEKVLHLRRTYHLGPVRIMWYLKRYHAISMSDANVYRILRRNGLNHLPRGTRMRKIHTTRYNKQVPGHPVAVFNTWPVSRYLFAQPLDYATTSRQHARRRGAEMAQEEKLTRRLAAILAADIVGYSALMGRDDEVTLGRLKKLRREVLEPIVAIHRGRIFKSTGDGVLVEFASPVEAARCAVEVQETLSRGSAENFQLRIGISLGDVIAESDGDIYGEGVNLAARLEQVADPGGVIVSGNVYDEVRGKLPFAFHDRGSQRFKNIAHSTRTFAVSIATCPPSQDMLPRKGQRPVVTVLPFVDKSSDASQQYFADGLSEDIVAALLRLSSIAVWQHHAGNQHARPPGEFFSLEGSVRRSGNVARVTTQLISSSGQTVWAEKYDFEWGDVFSIQDQLSRKIASALNVRVEAHERTNALTKPPTNLNAYDYYLRGRQLERSYDHQERARARGMFNAAIEADPLYARGYLGLAWFEIRALKWAETSEMEAILARAFSAASRAMELDSNDPDCHWLMGLIHLWRRDHAKSISCYERARAMNPNQPDLLADMADMFTYAGRSEEAIELATLACELNPNPPDWYYWNIAAGHFLIGRYEESLKHLQRMAQPGPAHRLFAATYAKLGRYDEAQRSAAALLEFTPDFSVRRYAAQAPYAREDDLDHYVTALRLAGLPD